MAVYVRFLVFLTLVQTVTSQYDYSYPDDPDYHYAVLTSSTRLEPLCDPDARVPEDLIQCGSCEGRCGNVTQAWETAPGTQCSCDVSCGYHGDCCRDFRSYCLEEYLEFQQVAARYPFTRRREDFQCRRFRSHFSSSSYLVVNTCPDGSDCKFSEELSEDVNSFVPMYDINRGVHFINGHCAVCNGARAVTPWGVKVTCSRPPPGEQGEEEFMQTGVLNSEESFTSLRENTKSCVLEYSVVGEPRPCHESTSTCKPGCQNSPLISACEAGPYAYTVLRGRYYKNLYCALCNAGDGDYSSGLSCGFELLRGPSAFPGNRDIMLDSFSLTMVFDFDPRKGLKIGTPECPDGEVYVPDESTCRRITCPSGFILDGSECIPEPSNITAVVTGRFRAEPSEDVLESLSKDQAFLGTSIKEDLTTTLDSYSIKHDNLDIETDVEFNRETLSVASLISCNCDYNSLFEEEGNETVFEDFENSIVDKIRKAVLMFLLKENINLESVRAHVKSSMNWSSPYESERLECTWLVYQMNETKSTDGTVTVLASGRTYASGMYEVLDDAVIVCETPSDPPGRTVDKVLSIVTLVCLGISILCLSVRIVLQFCISSFDTRPCRIQLQMTIALLLAFVLLVAGPFLVDVPAACTTAAILMAYGFLAAFTWMNVIAVDTWLVFRPSASFSRSRDDTSSLWVHYALGWGVPVILVAPSVVINYVDVDTRFRPEFGGSRCWYTQRYAMLVYFGVPIGMSILLNTVLYIHTSINLHKAFRNELTAMKAEKYHFKVFVKLFILMGITWIFGFVSAFTDQIVVDFIFVILTSLQGLFLFISVVWNKRVAMEIRKTVTSETSVSLSSSTRGTKSTPVPNYESYRSVSKV